MKKTIGGDRLGSGKRMKADIHGFQRSTHNKGYVWRSTIAAGTLVPFICEVALPGDTFDIDLDVDIKTHPTIGPLFGSYKIQADVFQCPIRLYNSLLHNNALNIGMNMSKVKLPVFDIAALDINPNNIDNCQINPSSILAYLGLKGVGVPIDGPTTRDFNAVPLLAVWDIYKNYYANKQEQQGAVIHTPGVALIETVDLIARARPSETNVNIPEAPTEAFVMFQDGDFLQIDFTGTQPLPEQIIINTVEHGELSALELCGSFALLIAGVIAGEYIGSTWGETTTVISWRYREGTDLNNGKPAVAFFPLENIDEMRKQILAFSDETQPFVITNTSLTPYVWPFQGVGEFPGYIPNIMSSQEGLPLKTYQSDLFNNWIDTEWIDGTNGISAVTAISTVGDSFTIDTLNLSKKVYDMLNRIAISGGTYDDWMDVVWGEERYRKAETPMYMGGMAKELVFQEVVSNAASNDQPLGTLAGRGVMAGGHKGGKVVIKVDEPSYIIGLISLTPRIDYSQGNNWDIHLKTLDDLHKPNLDEIGFQDLITEQMAWWDTKGESGGWVQKSAGKQPAWMNYMTSVNKTYGNFAVANNQMFMTLNRRYEPSYEFGDPIIKDLTTYIDPSKYNHIFAQTSLDAQNFWAQIAVDITARRKMSAKIMPNL